MTGLKGNTSFEGPAGQIEAILKEPAGPVSRAAVVCHPHPLFGGTMHNKVVYRIAKSFEQSGFAVLRFNFRGTGRSQGAHDHGRGERDDLLAALQFIEKRYAGAEIWLSGFSFGAGVMLSVACQDGRIRALVAAGVPVSKYDFSHVVSCDKPKLFVQGGEDEFGSKSDLEKFFDKLSEPKVLRFVEGADHFFEGRLEELARIITDFIPSVIRR